MDAITAALIGVIGMLVSGGFLWLRSEIVPRLDRMDERIGRIEIRFTAVERRLDRMDERLGRTEIRPTAVEGQQEAVGGG